MALHGRLGQAAKTTLALLMIAVAGACKDDGTGPDGVCARNEGNPTNISVGQTVNGTLSTNDCKDETGAYMDVYRLQIQTATTVTISMGSQQFDSYIWLVDANGNVIEQADDIGSSNDAALTRQLQPGTYFINASSFDEEETGSYTLSVQTGGTTGGSCTLATLSGDVAIPSTTSGSLTSSDCTFDDGSYADIYRIQNATSRTVTITMTSSAFNAYLVLFNSSGGLVTENDDGAGGTNARITTTLPAGTFYVAANSLTAAQFGTYSLSLTSP